MVIEVISTIQRLYLQFKGYIYNSKVIFTIQRLQFKGYIYNSKVTIQRLQFKGYIYNSKVIFTIQRLYLQFKGYNSEVINMVTIQRL